MGRLCLHLWQDGNLFDIQDHDDHHHPRESISGTLFAPFSGEVQCENFTTTHFTFLVLVSEQRGPTSSPVFLPELLRQNIITIIIIVIIDVIVVIFIIM